MTTERPTVPEGNGSLVTDRMAGAMIALMGGLTHGQVAFTRDQLKAMYSMYEFEPPVQLGPSPKSSRHLPVQYRSGVDDLEAAAAFRNMIRRAEADGLRLVAFLAKFMEPGEDPLRLVKEALSELGFDVQLEDDE